MRSLLAAVLLVLVPFAAGATDTWQELPEADLRAELDRVARELQTFRDLEADLANSERASSNAGRAAVIDELQQHMIDVVLRREDMLGVEHTIIRHGEPVSGLSAAAEVGTPNAGKETRRRMELGTSDKSEAFLRLAWMQQQVVGGERLYRLAMEKQAGAFAHYTNNVREFGKPLQQEFDGITAELARRAAAAAAADSAAAGMAAADSAAADSAAADSAGTGR
ncbi:MAG: hypothetical protein ABR506_01525 [Candidatus Krumholzibacteriia bacterium]